MAKLKIVFTLLLLWFPVVAQEAGTILTIAGGGTELLGSGIPATDAQLNVAQDIAVDSEGNLYIADTFNNIIRRIDAQSGEITTVAGTGVPGFKGDGGPATDAELNMPRAVAVNGAGEVFIGDTNNFRIRRIDPVTATITTIAGVGTRGPFPPRAAKIHADSVRFGEIVSILPGNDILLTGQGINGNLGTGNNQILQILLAQDSVQVLAGTGSLTRSGDGGNALNAGLTVEGMVVDTFGRLILADPQNHAVRFLEQATTDEGIPFSRIGLLAGGQTGIFGGGLFSGDGGPATDAGLDLPWGVASGFDGRIYIMDLANHRIRSVEPDETIVTVAGVTPGNVDEGGFDGDGGLALNATLNQPFRAVVNPDGDLIFIDNGNNRIRKIFRPEFRTSILKASAAAFNFGPVSLVIGGQRTLSLTNFGNQTFTITSISFDSPLFSTDYELPRLVGPNQSTAIDFRFVPETEDPIEATVTITTTDLSTPILTLPLTGSGVVPDIDVLPRQLTFDPTFTDQTRQLRLRVSNLTQGQLFLEGISISDTTNFTFTLLTESNVINAGGSENINVRFHPTRAGNFSVTLNILTNDPDEPDFEIPLQGIGIVPKPGGFVNVADSLGVADTGASFGVAWSDYDLDGDSDIYVVRSVQPNRLFRNDGDGFVDVAVELGLAGVGDGSGAGWADYDGDGDLDLYVTNFGQPNCLYRNDGSTFTEVAASAGVDDQGDGLGSAWSDTDRDGDPDLYVANFGKNVFYLNLGDGTFEEIADQLGIADPSSGIQPIFADFDNDTYPDLFVANSGANRFWRNNGDGTFRDATSEFVPQDNGPSTGAAVGDFDNDGFLDLYVVYFGNNRLYQNRNGEGFVDAGLALGVADPNNGRGAVWGDFDNDGFLDIFLTNRDAPNKLFRNLDGSSQFVEVGEEFGIDTVADSRGVALADFDGDGGLDLFVAIQDGADQLFRNFEAEGNWLTIVPRGTVSSSDAIGTRMRIVYDRTRTAIREIAGSTSFLSQDALSASFGIGEAQSVDTLYIRWPTGILQRFMHEEIEINRTLTIVEEQPLPPVGLLITTTTDVLVANGSAHIDVSVTVLNSLGEVTLINDRDVSFILDIGGGQVIASGPSVVDGFATARFTAGLIPGTISLTVLVAGLPSERVLLELIPPLAAFDTFIERIAGSGTVGFDGDNGPATNAAMNSPRAVAVDAQGNVYIADSANNRIRKVSIIDSLITTIAGSGATGIGGVIEGPALNADIGDPRGLTIDAYGDLIVSESGGQKVGRVSLTTMTATTFAGSGFTGFGGDGGEASEATLTTPRGLTTDNLGQIYIADLNNRAIRRVTDGFITTVAGDPLESFVLADGVPATESILEGPNGVAIDSEGNLYIAETQGHRIRKVDVMGQISTYAGDGTQGNSGDGGPASFARLNAPQDVLYNPAGRLIVSDSGNNKIRSIDLRSGIIQTIAGSGNSGANGDKGTALDFNLNLPAGIALAPDKSILIADVRNNRVLRLRVQFQDADPPLEPPPIHPGAGNGTPDFNDDGIVDFQDFLPFAVSFGTMNDTFDLDDDGWVGFSDFITFADAFGKPTTSNPAYTDTPPIWLRR